MSMVLLRYSIMLLRRFAVDAMGQVQRVVSVLIQGLHRKCTPH